MKVFETISVHQQEVLNTYIQNSHLIICRTTSSTLPLVCERSSQEHLLQILCCCCCCCCCCCFFNKITQNTYFFIVIGRTLHHSNIQNKVNTFVFNVCNCIMLTIQCLLCLAVNGCNHVWGIAVLLRGGVQQGLGECHDLFIHKKLTAMTLLGHGVFYCHGSHFKLRNSHKDYYWVKI